MILAEQAYLTARERGYSEEDILYLSAFETPSTNPQVDGAASSQSIEDAILDWASEGITPNDSSHWAKRPTTAQLTEWYLVVDGTRRCP